VLYGEASRRGKHRKAKVRAAGSAGGKATKGGALVSVLRDYLGRYFSKEQMWAPLLRLLPYVRLCRSKYVALSVVMVCNVIVSLYIARFLQTLTNSAIHHDLATIRWMLPIGVAVILFASGLSFAQTYLRDVVVNQIERAVQSDLYDHTLHLTTERLDAYHSGDIISRLTYDIRQMGSVVGIYILNMARLVLTATGALIYLLTLSWQLTISCVAMVPPVVVITLVVSRFARNNSMLISESLGQLQSFLSESLQGLSVIRAFALERPFSHQFRESTQAIVRLQLKNSKLRGSINVAGSMAHFIAYLFSFSLGAYYVAKGSMTVGSLLAVMTLMQNLIGPIMSAPRELGNYQAAMVAAKRIWGILDDTVESPFGDEESETTARVSPVASVSSVEFRNVSFRYPNGLQTLDNVSMTAVGGQVIALVGPSGAGKSTLFKLLLGLYPPNTGQILLNGREIRDFHAKQLRRLIAYVSQDTFLFSGTVRQNILYGLPDASDEQVIEAARDANAHDFIMALRDGYDTAVGERALRMSGGQRQRIAIARALLKNAPILLLDEATSALDAEAERLIQDALQRLAGGRTTFVIAHRLSTVVNADCVYVLENGQVIEGGTHQSLLNHGGVYAHLYNMQLQVDGQLAYP